MRKILDPRRRKGSVRIEDITEPHFSNSRKPSLAETNPEVALEWDYSKNCGWGPEDFSKGSGVMPWWQCPEDPEHNWQATINHRCGRGDDCPFCSGRRVCKSNSLATLFPKVAREWHKTKNGNLKPSQVTAYSKEKVWWLCLKGHEWKGEVGNRTYREANCRRCSKNMLDLTEYPEAMKYFDKSKNKGIDPRQVTMQTDIDWRCKKGADHRWRQKFTKKCRPEVFCPFCNNREVSKTNCLATLYPKLAKEFHKTRNGKLTPKNVIGTAGRSVWWKCSKCKHVWQAAVHARSLYETGCPRCWIKKGRPALLKRIAEDKKRKSRSKNKKKKKVDRK